jgi:hypothetical protein
LRAASRLPKLFFLVLPPVADMPLVGRIVDIRDVCLKLGGESIVVVGGLLGVLLITIATLAGQLVPVATGLGWPLVFGGALLVCERELQRRHARISPHHAVLAAGSKHPTWKLNDPRAERLGADNSSGMVCDIDMRDFKFKVTPVYIVTAVGNKSHTVSFKVLKTSNKEMLSVVLVGVYQSFTRATAKDEIALNWVAVDPQ